MNNAPDDEGLIDLGRLSVPPRHGASATSADFSFATEPPPPMANGRDEAGSASLGAHAKTIGIAAAAVAFVVMSCIGVAFAFRGEQAVMPPVVMTNALVAPAASLPTPVTAPSPEPAASAASAASSDDEDDSSSTTKPKKPRARGHAAQPRSAPAPAKQVKAADPCHCRGDFQCNIRCSANFKR